MTPEQPQPRRETIAAVFRARPGLCTRCGSRGPFIDGCPDCRTDRYIDHGHGPAA